MRGRSLAVAIVLVGIAAVAIGAYIFFQDQPTRAGHPRIDIVYTQPYPVLNAAISGFEDVVRKAYPQAEFIEHHANGRPEEYGTAVLAAISDHPDLLVPMTTPITSLAVAQARGTIPVVFIAVTDPVGAKVVRSLEHPGLSTGASDLCPYAPLLATARLIMPAAKTLGLPYNPTDQPAVFGRSQLLKLAPKYGFSIVDAQVSSASDLSSIVHGLASRSDAVLISSDNLTMENASAVASAAADQGKPVFACDSASVQSGALAGVAVNYRQVGELAGARAVQVLRGARPGDIPVAVLNSGGLAINRRAACILHMNIPEQTYVKATDVANRDYKCPR